MIAVDGSVEVAQQRAEELAGHAAELERRAVEADERLAGLRAQRDDLALDAALSRGDALQQLERLEREIAEADAEVGRLRLAAAQRERREAEARQQALDAQQAQALARARELGDERQRAARAVDVAARKLGDALDGYLTACDEQGRALAEAGRRHGSVTVRPPGVVLEGALLAGFGERAARFRSAGLLERVGLVPARLRVPLADVDHGAQIIPADAPSAGPPTTERTR